MSTNDPAKSDDLRAEYDLDALTGREQAKYFARMQAASDQGVSALRDFAFVIMPFAGGFEEIYSLFIAPALSEAGYRVARADDLLTQQNIVKDILAGISQSDLVVADLTTSNPNVYYELGLAHALGKRVVLLTQNVDELPFDLRSYRVITYSTHFADITKARERLVQVASEAKKDQIPFGSPVTDFFSTSTEEVRQSLSPTREFTVGVEQDFGLLDHLVQLEEGFANLSRIIASNNDAMNAIGEVTRSAGERLKSLNEANMAATTKRTVVVRLAAQLSEYAKSLGVFNDQYSEHLASTRTSLEFIIRAHEVKGDEARQQWRTFLDSLQTGEGSASEQRSSLTNLIEVIRSTPRIERSLTRATDILVRQLEGYAQNVDQTIAMIVRAREIAESRLAQSAA